MLGKLLGGRYRIAKHLGGGGFGQTYLADDLHLPGNPCCVVKHLKPKMTDAESLQAARRLFDTEAEVLYTLGNHPQVPRLFAHFEEDQDFFLVQEFIDGEVFSQELKTRTQFSEAEAIHLLQDILTVLEFVHQQQVIHRDIKPSNLIRRKSDRHLVLIDFGAVKQISMQTHAAEPETITVAVGSSSYMPNEQLAGMPRFASDIYAVGILAIHCLTGMYLKKLPGDPRTSEILWRDRVVVRSELADCLDRMVRYDFRQRYANAQEALVAIRSIAGTDSVSTLLAEPKLVSGDGHLAWLERGDEMFQIQRYQEAVTAYNKVIQSTPDDYLVWFKRGIALENLQFYEDAVASYDRVLKLQPEDYLAWYKQGNAYSQLQHYSEALQAYEQVVRLQADNYWAWLDRGRALENLGRCEEAVASYDRAVRLKPDFRLAVENRKRLLSQLKQVDTLYHLQHYDEAVASCDRAIEQNPNDSLAWFMRGMAMENLNQSEEAIAAYQKVVDIQPDDHLAWFKQGSLLEKLNRLEDALAAYHRVVQLQPHNYWAWHDRGKLLEAMGRFEEAIACYDRVVQLKHDFQAAVKGRTRILKQLHSAVITPIENEADEEDETIFSARLARQAAANTTTSEARAAIENDERPFQHSDPSEPSLSDSKASIGEASINEATDEGTDEASGDEAAAEITQIRFPGAVVEETIIHVSSVIQMSQVEPLANPTASPEADTYLVWFSKGRTLEKLQKYLEALAAFDHAIRICSVEDPELWQHRGNALKMLGRHQEAVDSYQRAIQLKQTSAELWCSLGSSLVRVERYADAVNAFDNAIQLKPNRHIPWYWRGRALFELERYSETIQSFERAIALKPDFQPAIADCKRVQNRLQTLRRRNVAV